MEIFQIYVYLHDSCCTQLCTSPGPTVPAPSTRENLLHPPALSYPPVLISPLCPQPSPACSCSHDHQCLHHSLSFHNFSFLTSFVFCHPSASLGGKKKKSQQPPWLEGTNNCHQHRFSSQLWNHLFCCHSRKKWAGTNFEHRYKWVWTDIYVCAYMGLHAFLV